MLRVAVLDYGVGNLYSVKHAVTSLGAEVTFVSSAAEISTVKRLIIPGVGSFAKGMVEIEKRGLVQPIQEYARAGRPLLGICLGMQLLFSTGEEFGVHSGLDILEGKVAAIPNESENKTWRKVPHIGWNNLQLSSGRESWQGTLLAGLREGVSAYFVHSYTAIPASPTVRVADCEYEGYTITAAVQKENIYGCQFHPEKSGSVGLAILNNFLGKH